MFKINYNFERFLPFIFYIHIIILSLIFLGVIFQGKKSLSYSITRWQLASVIVILWGFIYLSSDQDSNEDASFFS
jgi:hypothetical protein